jgi:addiction module RelE/StbE family toxin
MALKIVWTENAQKNRMDILEYWAERTLSKRYSKKLNQIFIQNAALLSRHPNLGKKTTMKDIRRQVIKDYMMFYKVVHSTLFILSIFDTRQHPRKSRKGLK